MSSELSLWGHLWGHRYLARIHHRVGYEGRKLSASRRFVSRPQPRLRSCSVGTTPDERRASRTRREQERVLAVMRATLLLGSAIRRREVR